MLILPSRRQFLTGLGATAAVTGATGAYAFGIEPLYRLVVTRYAPVLPRWTPGLSLRVAVLADFHVGEPYMPLDRIAEIVDATNALKPDLILMLGDYPAGPSVTHRKVPLTDFAVGCTGLDTDRLISRLSELGSRSRECAADRVRIPGSQ